MPEDDREAENLDRLRRSVEAARTRSSSREAPPEPRVTGPAMKPESDPHPAEAAPQLGGGLQPFAGFLVLHPMLSLFDFAARLAYDQPTPQASAGGGKRASNRPSPFTQFRSRAPRIFRFCFFADAMFRLLIYLLLIATLVVVLWKSFIGPISIQQGESQPTPLPTVAVTLLP